MVIGTLDVGLVHLMALRYKMIGSQGLEHFLLADGQLAKVCRRNDVWYVKGMLCPEEHLHFRYDNHPVGLLCGKNFADYLGIVWRINAWNFVYPVEKSFVKAVQCRGHIPANELCVFEFLAKSQ